MPSDSDLLCGRIAIELGFCTEAQVEKCLRIQAASKTPMPLGRILIDEAALTEDQHSKVLEIQRSRMRRPDPVVKASKEDTLFGTLAVREGWVTREQMNACLRIQGQLDEKRTLGEVLVAERLLTTVQVKALLAKQSKKIMSCAGCRVSFTVHTISRGKSIPCPRCRKPLQDGKPGDSVRTDGDLSSDSVVQAREAEVRPRRGAPGTPSCRFCGSSPVGPRAPDGRVECLTCHVRFVP